MEFSNRFWRKLTKKDSVESAKYEKTVFLLIPEPVHAVFGIFFHVSGSGFSSDPDPDSGKKFDPDPGKKPDPKHCIFCRSESSCCSQCGAGSRCDPDPALKNCGLTLKLCKNYRYLKKQCCGSGSETFSWIRNYLF